MSRYLENLNPNQLEVINDNSDALLILAGAGSGKTRVITNKIAYILDENLAKPWEILAITFTKKAANEMKERITKMIGEGLTETMWVGTFHSICSRILRWNQTLQNTNKNFVIYDSDDSLRLIKNILKDFEIDTKANKPSSFAYTIEQKKNELISPEEFLETAETLDFDSKTQAKVYAEYQKRLRTANALDFNDLIGETISVLKTNYEIRMKYINKFKYIFVDEYQDTNKPQFLLLQLLSGRFEEDYKNIPILPKVTVVGDPDQSIYSFRGATIRNIREFERDFMNSKTVKLEQNYRSTNNILKAANLVINKLYGTNKRNLWSENGDGERIVKANFQNGYDEARWVVEQIKNLVQNDERFDDIAVIYRVNSLSRLVEEKLIEAGLGANYKVIGGFKFYERKEVKDILAYLFCLANLDDDVHIRRIINVPKRGIGASSEEKVAEFANDHGCSFWVALDLLDEISGINQGTKAKMLEFQKLILELREMLENGAVISDVILQIIEKTKYLEELKASLDPQDQVRADNVEELVSAAAAFVPLPEIDEETGQIVKVFEEAIGLDGANSFLEQISLAADSDQLGDEEKVTLMSLHTAKGLEYKFIFLIGLEEGTLPHINSMMDETELEEERRLTYVGITRAKSKLFLSWSASRNNFGNVMNYIPSRFFNDIDSELIEEYNKFEPDFSETSFNRTNRNYSNWNQNSKPNYNNRYQTTSRTQEKSIKEILKERETTSGGEFAVGDLISHEKFGLGTILKITGKDSKEVAEIQFNDVGIKQLMLSFAKIVKL